MTGGDRVHEYGADFTVPRNTLIAELIAHADQGTFQAVKDLPHREDFEDELQSLRRKISATGRATMDHPAGKHDDLIVAVALAVWFAGRRRQVRRMIPLSGW